MQSYEDPSHPTASVMPLSCLEKMILSSVPLKGMRLNTELCHRIKPLLIPSDLMCWRRDQKGGVTRQLRV